MIDQKFRSFLETRVDYLLRLYQLLHLSPNAITILGLIFGLAAATALALEQSNYLVLALWWLGRLFDGTDGIYARKIQKSSDFGGYLDITADMTAYSAMIIGFAISRPLWNQLWIVILFLYVLCITTALSLGSLQKFRDHKSNENRKLKIATGLAEGGETGIFYTLLLLTKAHTFSLCILWIFILLSTVVARTIVARRELKAS